MIGARPLTDTEITRLLRNGFTGHFKHRNRSMFAIGLSTGFRISELLSLEMRQVMHRKYPKDYIKIDRRNVKGRTQGRTQRLHQVGKDALQPWIDERLDNTELATLLDQPVFISREKDTRTRNIKPITREHASYILNQAYNRCNITGSVSTHSMRKTFAKKIYEDAVKKFKAGQIFKPPINVTKDQLGQRSVQSTESYLSFLNMDSDPSLFTFEEAYTQTKKDQPY